MTTTHEEVDVIIPQQVVNDVKQGTNGKKVLCDDTDVFALLLHFYVQEKLTCQLFMEGTNATRTSVDIAATTMKHQEVISYLLAALLCQLVTVWLTCMA